MENKTITEVLKIFNTGSEEEIKSLVDSLWYDWFCSDKALHNKGVSLLKKLNAISSSKKFDNDKTYVFFKNNCPVHGDLYDDFRICDLESGDVIYTVTPKVGYDSKKRQYKEGKISGLAQVWGADNSFNEELIQGTWKEIKDWFFKKEFSEEEVHIIISRARDGAVYYEVDNKGIGTLVSKEQVAGRDVFKDIISEIECELDNFHERTNIEAVLEAEEIRQLESQEEELDCDRNDGDEGVVEAIRGNL